jgi:hypothetical protein
MRTLEDITTTHGVEVLDYLDRQVTIPVLRDPQIQGDVSILPVTTKKAVTPIPRAGVAVVVGENGGNTHSLHGEGCFFDFAPSKPGSLKLGTLTVPENEEAYLIHPEHGAMGMAPGTYTLGRQREYAGEWRQVAD